AHGPAVGIPEDDRLVADAQGLGGLVLVDDANDAAGDGAEIALVQRAEGRLAARVHGFTEKLSARLIPLGTLVLAGVELTMMMPPLTDWSCAASRVRRGLRGC